MQPAPADRLTAALIGVLARAPVADRGEISLAADLVVLHETGVLADVVRHTGVGCDAVEGARLLRRIGRASLPVGRIVEGHANALRLLMLYGSAPQRRQYAAAAAEGAVFGVWGADGATPVRIVSRSGTHVVLDGTRQFCSGIGLLTFAILPVQTDAGSLLVLADVRDSARADASVWKVSGMRATVSGRYDVTGLECEILGQPGDYMREPHFEGGIWRYCALHCGGLEALADAVRMHLLARGQRDNPHQRERLARLVILAQTARLWVDSASRAVEGGGDVTSAVTQALLAREAVEQACLAGIALAERALGTAAFASDGDADRIRRDLAFFLRQANLDGKLAAAGDALLAQPQTDRRDLVMTPLLQAALTARGTTLAELSGGGDVVLLAPHPDDESLGCGAAIAAMADLGRRVQVIVITDGCHSHPASRDYPAERLRGVRAEEVRRAVDILTVGRGPEPVLLDYPDNAAPDGDDAAADAASRIQPFIGSSTTALWATWEGDPHPDHGRTARIAAQIAAHNPTLSLWSYAIWGRFTEEVPGFDPATLVQFATEPWQTRKAAAVAAHTSQMTGLISDDPVDSA